MLMASTLIAGQWEFTQYPDILPTDYENNYSWRRDFLAMSQCEYNGGFAFSHPYDGFSTYKNGKWSFFTPKKISEMIENKEEVDTLNLNSITLEKCYADSSGNLWLASHNVLFRYNDATGKIRVFHKFKINDNTYFPAYFINQTVFDDGKLYTKVFFKDTTDKEVWFKSRTYFYDDKSESFVQMGETDILDILLHRNDFKIVKGKPIRKKDLKLEEGTLPKKYGNLDNMRLNIFYKLDNDTLLKNYGLFFLKYHDGKLVEIDSTFFDFVRSEQMKPFYYYHYYSLTTLFDNTLYMFAMKFNEYYKDKLSLYDQRIFTYNFKTRKIDSISTQTVPIVFYEGDNPNAYYPSDIQVNKNGRINIFYDKLGFFDYNPESKVEDDRELVFVVGVSAKNPFPNPTSDKCHVDFFLNRLHADNIKVQICNINGEIVKDITSGINYNSGTQSASLDFTVGELPQGNYYVLFTTNRNKQMKGLLIIK